MFSSGQSQIDINTVVSTVAAVSVAMNGWFLRGVARRIDLMDDRQRRHGDRLVWLEARANGHPRRRAHETSGPYEEPEDGQE